MDDSDIEAETAGGEDGQNRYQTSADNRIKKPPQNLREMLRKFSFLEDKEAHEKIGEYPGEKKSFRFSHRR